MLVIISDLHLNDGSTGDSLAPGRILAVRPAAEGFGPGRRGGQTGPIDPSNASTWSCWAIRSICSTPAIGTSGRQFAPGNLESPEFFDQIARITTEIVAHNQSALCVCSLGRSATRCCRRCCERFAGPPGSEDQPVPIRIHYMVGNHDWFYHLPGPQYDKLRRSLVERLGLANRSDRPFPHDITESDELLQAMRRHKVTARHGDLYGPLELRGRPRCQQPGRCDCHRAVWSLHGRGGNRSLGDALPAVPPCLELRCCRHLPAAVGRRMARWPAGADLHGRRTAPNGSRPSGTGWPTSSCWQLCQPAPQL